MGRNTQRFRRIGEYDFEELLKDLRDFESEMLGVKDEVDGGGLVGPQGPPGVKGEPGDRSTVPGPTGAAGANGLDGSAGLSAYEIAVQNGFEGDEQEWLDSLQATASDISGYRDDWGFINTDWGSVTDSVVSGTEDYGALVDG